MNIIESKDISHKLIKTLFTKSNFVLEDIKKSIVRNEYNNKIIVLAFFEPSTRTSLSFESAMYKLGGKVISFNADTSSIEKGEGFEDTIRTLSSYGDIMIIRHPEKGMVSKATSLSSIPIVNAGDGNGEHPTQALTDIYTMYKKYGWDFTKKSILITGDIKNNRTIHSLINILNIYQEMKIYLLPYKGLEPDDDLLNNISRHHNQNKETIIVNLNSLNYNSFDILYCTRIQKERFDNDYEIISKKQIVPDFIIDETFVDKMNEDAIVMHPLPRNNELSTCVDKNKRCYYFKQIEYGTEIRIVLLHMLLRI